jgi:hypothetical protein
MTTDTTILDMDALLDETLDTVADVPDYVTPPEGVYTLKVSNCELSSREDKTTKAKTSLIAITYEVVTTHEVKDNKEPPVANGSLFSERFQVTEEGKAYFKRAAKNILQVSSLDGVSLRDIFATLKDSQAVRAVINHSESASADRATKYTNLRIRIVGLESAQV